MRNPFSKIVRHLRREYPGTTSSALMATLTGVGAGALMAIPGGQIFLIPIYAGLYGVGGTVVHMGMSGQFGKHGSDSLSVNGFTVVGDGKSLKKIDLTQKLIYKMTQEMQHLPELPEKMKREIAAHIEDIEKAIKKVRVYKDGVQVESFSFARFYYNERGVIAIQNTPAGKTAVQKKSEAPKSGGASVKTLPKITLDFSDFSKKAENENEKGLPPSVSNEKRPKPADPK